MNHTVNHNISTMIVICNVINNHCNEVVILDIAISNNISFTIIHDDTYNTEQNVVEHRLQNDLWAPTANY